MIHTSLSSNTTPQDALDIFAGANDGGAPHCVSEMVMVRFTNTSAITINGILTPVELGAAFKLSKPIFCVVTDANITLTHNSGSAAAGRKIFTQGASLTLSANACFTLAYDPVSLVYRVVGRASSG